MPPEKEKMLAGDSYGASDPELVVERKRARRLTRRFNDTDETRIERREELIWELFGAVGESLEIEPPFRCDYGYNVRAGEEFFANFDCVFLDVCLITIGDDCQLGPGVHTYTATHPAGAAEQIKGPELGKPVTIGDNAWLSGHVVVNPGVTIGDDAVITSGAVVTDDVPDGVVVGENPAHIVKELDWRVKMGSCG